MSGSEGPIQLLLVEDNPADARLVQEMLGEAPNDPLELTQVGTLGEALAHLQSSPVSCVLLDLGLPDATGREALLAIVEAAPWVPVVVLTGIRDQSLGMAAVREGAQDYLAKASVDPELLSRSIRYAIQRHEDVIERRRGERELQLLQSVTLSASEAPDVSSALGIVVRKVCESTGWDYGEAWLPNGRGVLTLSPAWHSFDEDLGGFRAASEALVFERGVGLPGRVWASGAAAWIPDLSREENFPRREAAGQFGLRAGLSMPVLAGDQVVAVMEFFVTESRDEDGRLLGVVSGVAAQLGNVIRRKQAEEALRQSEEHFRLLAENARDFIFRYRLGPTPGFEYVSPASVRLTGYTPDEYYADPSLLSEAMDPDGRARWEAAQEDGFRAPLTTRLRHKDGSDLWLEQLVTPIVGPEGPVLALECIARDVTERIDAEQRLVHQALHDSLSGLPNRSLFLDRLTQALARGGRSGTPVTVFCLDLDRFKVVNDSLGHGAGDDVLVTLAGRLRAVLRSSETLARFGGDEFVLLCEDYGEGDVSFAAQRMAQVIGEPINIHGRQLKLTASIGVAASTHSGSPEELLRGAEVAMYLAKERGRDRYEVFHEGMQAAAVKRLDSENDLRRAIEDKQLRLHYQPKFHLGGDTTAQQAIIGFEALVRWEHPTRGLVPPGEFIPLAEETGLIVPIGAWVLQEACQQLSRWREFPSPAASELTMSVNVSARQLTRPDLVESVSAVLEDSGLEAAALELEITESAIMADVPAAMAALGRLHQLGVSLAVDDFGTGYSSLSYLKRFPVDCIKIDRSFVDGLGRDSDDAAIAAAVVGMGRALGMTTVGEGVETFEQLVELQALGCDMAQGYYFARPQPPEAIDELMAELPASPEHRPGRLKVLVCDDEPSIRMLYRSAFEAAGASVEEAADGHECIQVADGQQPDLVVLDLLMPNRDGMSALAELGERCPHADVIMVSLATATELVERATDQGATAFFEKLGFLRRIPKLVAQYPRSSPDSPAYAAAHN